MFFETTLTAERIATHTTNGVYTDRLLNDFVDDSAKRQPHKTAIVDVRSRYAYGELRARGDTAALGFLDCGLRRGDVVTVQLPNWNEFVIVALALERIGAVIKVTPQFWPEQLLVLDALPMTPSGKIQKFHLRQLAAEDGAGPSFARGC